MSDFLPAEGSSRSPQEGFTLNYERPTTQEMHRHAGKLHQTQGHPEPGVGQPPPPPGPPAMNHVPQDPSRRPLVETSDIRRERERTEADYRDDLTEYVVYRFEKVLTDVYDSDSDKIKATWENCLRTRMTGISKKMAFREIQSLNRTKPLAEKRKGLLPSQQQQLEKALDDLSAQDNDARFGYTLVQIDHQLKPLDSERYSSVKGTAFLHKRKYQRVPITAYYKRAPLTTINAGQLARDIQLEAHLGQQRALPFQLQPPRQHIPSPESQLPLSQMPLSASTTQRRTAIPLLSHTNLHGDKEDIIQSDVGDTGPTNSSELGGFTVRASSPITILESMSPDGQMPCPFRFSYPLIYNRDYSEKYSACHTKHENISTIV